MNTILFSIIVPCYNVQDYLEECVKSILVQTYEFFEIILIDDGATDSTPAICDQLAALDKRVVVYHKQNGGLSDARNYGVERANGDYLVFVDSDDFIDNKALEYFASVIETSYPDVLLTRLTEYYDNGDIIEQDMDMRSFFFSGVSTEKALLWDMRKSRSSWPAPKKILSQKFIDRYKLRFIKGYLHEDLDWSSRVMMYAETIDICTEIWYYHRMQRTGSIMNTISDKRITDVIEMANRLVNGIEMNTISKSRRKIITDRIMRSVYPQLMYYDKLSLEGRMKVVECCERNASLFRLAPETKYEIFAICSRMFGFRTSLNLLARIGGLL